MFWGTGVLVALAAGSFFRMTWIELGVWIVIAVGAMIALRAMIRWRTHENNTAIVRYLATDEGITRLGGGTLHPWTEYSYMMLLSDGPASWRLHIYPNWWRIPGPPMVNTRISGSEKDAEALRSELQRRMDDAKRAAKKR